MHQQSRSHDLAAPGNSETESHTVFCAQVKSDLEFQVLQEWIDHRNPNRHNISTLRVSYPAASPRARAEQINPVVDRPDPTMIVPLRVAWGERALADKQPWLLTASSFLSDTRHPGPTMQRWFLRSGLEHPHVVVGEQATLAQLRAAFAANGHDTSGPDGFAMFVARRLSLALEREESHLFGPQYKVPRLVEESVLASSRFQEGVDDLAHEISRDRKELHAEAARYLTEMVTGFSRPLWNWRISGSRLFYRQGYQEALDYDWEQVRQVREALQVAPGVLLPTHRTYLDECVMPVALRELDLPPAHTFAGINMAFWPIGSFVRRSGTIPIRRAAKDNPVYRFVLRQYVGFLVEKRFPLTWYLEGSRSRTGKLLPPRMGLLNYVVSAYLEGRTEDLMLVPISITYDHLRETAEFAGEALGGQKRPEDLGWFVRYWATLRGRYGKIYIRFGDPLSLRSALNAAPAEPPADRDVVLRRLAFEVCRRINRVTPVTASALIALTLLTTGDTALTFRQLSVAVREFILFTRQRGIPMTDSARHLDTDNGLNAALGDLVRHRLVTRVGGIDDVYLIERGRRIEAGFYRNSIAHHFLNRAIVEFALVRAARSASGDRLDAFWSAAAEMRDILIFDFFLLPREKLRAALDAELTSCDPDWEHRMAGGTEEILGLLLSPRPVAAVTILRPFLEGYFILAVALEEHGDAKVEEEAILKRCSVIGRQLLYQGRVKNAEAVSEHIFKSGLQLAKHRGLLDGRGDVGRDRSEFAHTLRDALKSVTELEQVARRDFAELLALSR